MSDALTVAQIAGILNIASGALFMVALGLFCTGFSVWVTHLGLPHRDEGLLLAERAVAVLFTLVCILAIVRFFQFHTRAVLQVLAIALILLGGGVLIASLRSGDEADEKKK